MNFLKRKSAASTDAKRDIHVWQQQLANQAKSRLQGIHSNLHADPPDDLPEIVADGFAYVTELTNTLMRTQPLGRKQRTKLPPASHHFVVSSLFLLQAWHYLTTDPEQRERMLLITGPVTADGTIVLSDMHRVQTSQQSAVIVQAHPQATAAQIDTLTDTHQHHLHAMWHSHILTGAASSQPSQIDLQHQERMVTIGMPETLGGIFTLDGYVRFFSTAIDFDLTLYGAHVELVSNETRTKVLKLNTEGVNRDVLAIAA